MCILYCVCYEFHTLYALDRLSRKFIEFRFLNPRKFARIKLFFETSLQIMV